MSNPPASLEGIRKDDGWKRPLSVFANSTYQPQQMLFDSGKAHESSTAGWSDQVAPNASVLAFISAT